MLSTWKEFEEMAESLAQLGRERLDGQICYLATTQPSGAPRVHPVTPIIGGDNLYVFMEPTSPKRSDLNADERFSLHSSVRTNAGEGGEFLVNGTAVETDDDNERRLVNEASSYEIEDRYVLFRLDVGRVLYTEYEDAGPERERWHSLTK
jgi:hypothetical protein